MEEQFISIQLGGARHCLVAHITQRGESDPSQLIFAGDMREFRL